MADVFISYARTTEPAAQRVVERLTAAGYRVWRDDQIPAHRPYAEVIEERLREARCVVVLWSAEAVRSQWVRAEADIARGEGKLVQARVDGATPPLPFDQIQHADLRGWKGEADHPGWRKIEESIRALAGEPSQTPPPSAPASARRRIPMRLLGAVAAVVLVGLAAGWWFAAGPGAGGGAADGQVSILPLASERATHALAQEVQDQIVGRLNGVGVSPLTDRTGRGAHVALLVDGRLQAEDGVMRARMRIVQGADGAVLWSGLFERPADQAAALPDQVAAKVADVVDCGVRSVAADARLSTSARTHYLQFCDLRRRDGRSAEAFDAIRAVTEEAPRFSPGWSGLAMAATFSLAGLPLEQRPAARAQALAAADRAIRLDPHAAMAYMGRALLVLPHTNWAERARWMARAVADADHVSRAEAATIQSQAGEQALEAGYVADHLAMERRARALDPNSAAKADGVVEALAMAGETTQAARDLAAAEQAWPGDPYVRSARFDLHAFADPGAAARLLDDPQTRPAEFGDSGVVAWRAFATASASGDARAKDAAAERLLQAMHAGAIDRSRGVRALLALGREAEVAGEIRAQLAGGGAADPRPLFSPQAARFRQGAPFVALMRDLGLAAYWRQSGKWPDFCADPGLPYRCADAFR